MPALFDLDNTLVDRDEAFRRWAEEFADGEAIGILLSDAERR